MDVSDFPRSKRLPPYVFNIVGDLKHQARRAGDYGIFQPVQVAAIHALSGPQDVVEEIRQSYQRRRDVLVSGLNRIGWHVRKPKATMFVWAPIPEPLRHMGSLEFSKFLLRDGKVAVSPGIGFGEYGDGYVRFALIENEHRTRQAIRGIGRALSQAPVAQVRKVG
jgi:alanine-synthesizing transaminase